MTGVAVTSLILSIYCIIKTLQQSREINNRIEEKKAEIVTLTVEIDSLIAGRDVSAIIGTCGGCGRRGEMAAILYIDSNVPACIDCYTSLDDYIAGIPD